MNLSQFLASGGGKLRYQEFLASGTFTPSDKLRTNGGQCFVTALAGGGSGGAARLSTTTNLSQACGGDAGQFIEGTVTVAAATTVTIGAGGSSVATTGTTNFNTNGNDGQDTTFGALLTAKGGKGGIAFDSGVTTRSARGGDGIAGQGQYVTDTATTLSARGGLGKNGKGGGGGGCATYGVSHMTATDGGGAAAAVTGAVNVTANSATANSGSGGGGATLGLVSANSQTVTSGAGGSGWLRVVWFE